MRLATAWTVWGSNVRGLEIFFSHSTRLPDPVTLMCYDNAALSHGVKRSGRGRHSPYQSSADVKETVELSYNLIFSGPCIVYKFLQ